METRRPRTRMSYKQLKLLIKFMIANPNLAKGVNYRTTNGRLYYERKWTELANIMNAQENGCYRSPREWNRYWKDLKCTVRKKVRAMKKRSGRRKVVLNSLEQVIYKNMCESTVADDKTRSYLDVPEESDYDDENYEVEYLEDSSCDEAHLSNVTVDPLTELAYDDTNFDSEAVQTNVKQEHFLDEDKFLIETLLNNSKSTAEEQSTTNRETNNLRNGGVVLNVNVDNERTVLTDIRDQVKELVKIQKEKAKSAQRMATAHERRAILEEKRVKIEERRLKMEERRVALEEKKMEAAEKRAFAEERLATAAERRNDLAERKMVNAT